MNTSIASERLPVLTPSRIYSVEQSIQSIFIVGGINMVTSLLDQKRNKNCQETELRSSRHRSPSPPTPSAYVFKDNPLRPDDIYLLEGPPFIGSQCLPVFRKGPINPDQCSRTHLKICFCSFAAHSSLLRTISNDNYENMHSVSIFKCRCGEGRMSADHTFRDFVPQSRSHQLLY